MSPKPPAFENVAERIEDIDVTAEMETSFLEYAYSVIYSRALPDARDGLKPVQRRILYQMAEMGLTPDRGHVKSARVTGEVMGKLHPHGDAAIYDALVRMAQSFTLRVPLVDGHGNFGSLDDGPAAARYTEARLAATALELTANLDEDVVDFVPNYDNQLMQPSVLPAAFPNLLVNGASGIAVGMATNMAPHNLAEVIGAACHLLDNPKATLEELMRYVPGPDFPSGGTIVGLDGVREAYETGRGSFRVRATATIEKLTARKTGIIVTALPYGVGPEKVIEKIKQGVNNKKLSGISNVTDLSDLEHELRLVIEVKTGFVAEAVLAQLYKHTPLEESFAINNVALVDGNPLTLGLKPLLDVYLEHRISVITRRSKFRLAKRKDRLHLVEGLLIAILDIDEVIQVIRSSDDTSAARKRLRQVFDLSKLQADYILELRLRRLTKFSRIELEDEKAQLIKEIAELEALLGSSRRINSQVAKELQQVARQYGTPRRTVLLESAAAAPTTGSAAPQLQAQDEPCIVLLSAAGLLLRVDGIDDESAISAAPRRQKHDALSSALLTTTHTELGALTADGTLLRFSALDLPVASPHAIQFSAGVRATEYLGLPSGSTKVVTLVDLANKTPLALGTAQGVVKRLAPDSYLGRESFEVIALKDGDSLVGAAYAPDDSELVFVTSDAQLLHFEAVNVRPQGRTAGGMAGIRVSDGVEAIGFYVLPATELERAHVVTIAGGGETLFGADAGSAKLSPFSEFPAKGRATAGVRAQRFLKGEDTLLKAWVGCGLPRALDGMGSPAELPTELAKRDASGAPLTTPVQWIGSSMDEAGRSV